MRVRRSLRAAPLRPCSTGTALTYETLTARRPLTATPTAVTFHLEALLFNNLMQVVTLTGAQLDALLEQQVWTVAANGTVTHRILQPSASLTYTFDTTQAVGSRVSNIKINGVAVTDSQSIRVAANNFLVGGGDGFTVFTQGTDKWSGPLDIDAFVSHFGAHSPIAPPTADRITFVK